MTKPYLKPKTTTEALANIIWQLDNDPAYLADVREQFLLDELKVNNQLICSVIDRMYYEDTWGDAIAYGHDHNYYINLSIEALDLFYQNHGQGD